MSSSTIDPRTADVIRTAVSAAQAGRVQEACELGERGIAEGCDAAPLEAMIGAFLVQSKQFDASISHLEAAREAKPSDPIIARNLATALVGCERFSDAVEILEDELVDHDQTGNLFRLRGFAAQMAGDVVRAADAYAKVLSIDPGDWETWNNLGNVREIMGDATGAIDALKRAMALNPQSLGVQLNLVLLLYAQGTITEAEAHLRRMTVDFPHDAVPWQCLYTLLKEQSWDEEAKEVLDGALERDPSNLAILTVVGKEHLLSFEMAKARTTFRKILELDPANGDAFIGLAEVLEREQPHELPKLIDEAEAARVDPVAASMLQATLALREKRYRDGADALASIPADVYPVRRWHLVGQLSERLGEPEIAFEAFTKLNEVQARDPTRPLVRAAALRERLRERLQCITPKWRDGWRTSPIASERTAPVFLVGFPRSGTTLLDTILMGHRNIQVLEERPVLHTVSTEFGGFDAIADLDAGTILRAQDRYFELANQFIALRSDALLIDKSPLHMQNVPQISRLFPNAHFILALRHPADVVLSCFMANFRLNSAMANFLQLETAAEFYDLTFCLWEKSRSIFPVQVHTVVYEEMVQDPALILRHVVEGLGLEWEPAMLDHQQTAERRGVITTASYAQVTEPIYKSAVGRWKRYSGQLEAILPVLAPWIDKLGYEM